MIGLRYKSGVRLNLLTPQIVLAIQTALPLYAAAGAPELWVTSINDSEHMATSLHYVGRAVDLRITNVAREKRPVLYSLLSTRLETAMGYTVLWEYPDQPQEHIHIQYRETRS